MSAPFLWAHRGDSAWAPENTIAAFAAAVESGADGIELDVHLSSDGIPVVIHDETLERTTDGSGLVARTTSQQLAGLDAGSWFSPDFSGEKIPLLSDVLRVFSGCLKLNLEIKDFRAGVAALDLVRQYPDADILFSSFDHNVLRQLRHADQSLSLAVLFAGGSWRRAVRFAIELKAYSFHPEAGKVHRPMLAECRQAGLHVHVWTVDEPSLARSLVRSGVSGIFSNDPLKLKNACFSSF